MDRLHIIWENWIFMCNWHGRWPWLQLWSLNTCLGAWWRWVCMLVMSFDGEIAWNALLWLFTEQTHKFMNPKLFGLMKNLSIFFFYVILLSLRSNLSLESLQKDLWLIFYDFCKLVCHYVPKPYFCSNFLTSIEPLPELKLIWNCYILNMNV
jgi:hypothetical protein